MQKTLPGNTEVNDFEPFDSAELCTQCIYKIQLQSAGLEMKLVAYYTLVFQAYQI